MTIRRIKRLSCPTCNETFRTPCIVEGDSELTPNCPGCGRNTLMAMPILDETDLLRDFLRTQVTQWPPERYAEDALHFFEAENTLTDFTHYELAGVQDNEYLHPSHTHNEVMVTFHGGPLNGSQLPKCWTGPLVEYESPDGVQSRYRLIEPDVMEFVS